MEPIQAWYPVPSQLFFIFIFGLISRWEPELIPPHLGAGIAVLGGAGGVSELREVPSELGIGRGSRDITLLVTNWVAKKDLDTFGPGMDTVFRCGSG